MVIKNISFHSLTTVIIITSTSIVRQKRTVCCILETKVKGLSITQTVLGQPTLSKTPWVATSPFYWRRTEPGGKQVLTRTPDPIRPTRWGPDPNRPTCGRKEGGLSRAGGLVGHLIQHTHKFNSAT